MVIISDYSDFTVLDTSNTSVAGSNPARVRDGCPWFCVWCPVYVQGLRCAESTLKDAYKMS